MSSFARLPAPLPPRSFLRHRLPLASGVASLLLAATWQARPIAAQQVFGRPSGPFQQLAENDDFGSSVQSGVTLKQPLLGQSAAPSHDAVKTVEVKGIGSTAEDAQRDAARQAVQQVAGLYIDARRQVESKITDKAVSDIVHEKILSYSNAYITRLEVTNTGKQPDGLMVVTAKASVAIAPLIKILQSNNVPTVAFDTNTAVGQVEVAAHEKQGAIDLYADLVKRSADLITLSVGTPRVNVALQAPVDKSWLTIPVTYVANEEAVREWRSKFERIASKHMSLEMPVERQLLNAGDAEHSCAVGVFDAQDRLNNVALQQSFLGTQIPLDQHGITACFAQGRGSTSVSVDCFGRAFLNDAQPSSDICKGPDCLSLGDSTRKLGMRFELLDASGEVIDAVPVHFNSFPMLNVAASTTMPPRQATGFFNFCAPDQGAFYFFGRYFGAYGDVIVLPRPGERLHAYGNFLLPNDVIARTASLRVHIVRN